MPFSSVLGASSVIKPGVCTSTTRPSVPFEGQLIYETDTDRLAVYTGTTWSYMTGSAAPPGLIYLTSATFTTASSVSLPANTFTSTYLNYRVFINISASSTNQTLSMRVNASGAAQTLGNYYQHRIEINGIAQVSDNGSSSANINRMRNAHMFGSNVIDVFSPADSSIVTAWTYQGNGETTAGNSTATIGGGFYNLAGAHDGLTFFVGGTMSGIIRVYGYANS